jgi:siroheme synthase-like protein
VRVIAPEISDALERMLAGTRAVVERRPFADGDVADAQLVFAATASPEVNARVAAEATARCRLVNVADDMARSAFSSAAQIGRGPLVVGVFASGVPDVALRVRDAVAERIGAEYGDAATRLRDMRRAALEGGDRESWDRARRDLAGADFCATVDAGAFPARADAWR